MHDQRDLHAHSGGNADGHPDRHQFLSSILVNDTIALDAGCLGLYHSPQEQARVRHVLLSHSHIDHLASLPIFVENAYEGKTDCVHIYGSAAVLDSCQRDLFNDRLQEWEDFYNFSRPHGGLGGETPYERLREKTTSPV